MGLFTNLPEQEQKINERRAAAGETPANRWGDTTEEVVDANPVLSAAEQAAEAVPSDEQPPTPQE